MDVMERNLHREDGLASTTGALADDPGGPIKLSWHSSSFPLGGTLPSNLRTTLPRGHATNLLTWAELGGVGRFASVMVVGLMPTAEMDKLDSRKPLATLPRLERPDSLESDFAGWEISLHDREDVRVVLLADGTLRRLGNPAERTARWLADRLPTSIGFDELTPDSRKRDPVERMVAAIHNAKVAMYWAPGEQSTAVFHRAIVDALDSKTPHKVPHKQVWDAAELSRARVYQIRKEVHAADAAAEDSPGEEQGR
ncbi:hypothetical protein [Saccharothrix sp. HUAS TT1]|uniref:hypothetical protein n=1 Tax=unclassified Saccharothrix TaxID=2593673 RepID=UPI00345BE3C1